MEPDRAEHLLTELPWLQGLARRLARDADTAADAVQDTCAIALQQANGVAVLPRAWLATVLRNCLQMRRRGGRARRRREHVAAQPGEVESTAALVQRAELQQRLVGAVLRLPAHYRDVVLLRFFDGLPPRKIANRQGVPVATVHSRLQRASAQLRRELDRGTGGRAGWIALAGAWPASPLLPLLGVIMETKLKIAAAVVVAAGTVTLFWSGALNGGERTTTPASAEPRARSAGGGDDGSGMNPAAPVRRALAESPPRAPHESVARVTVRGVVRDCSGAPLAGAPVAARGDDGGTVITDAGGAFELAVLPRPTSFAVDGDRFVTVLGADWSPETSFAPVVIAAPAIRVGGSVLDAAGAAITGAQVALLLPDDFDARFPMLLDRGRRQRWQAGSTDRGGFDLGRIPRIDGAVLFAAADAFQPVRVELPPADDEHVQIVLAKFAYQEGQLEGVVVDLQGAPVAGARVAMGVTSVVSDANGRFALLLRRAGWPTAIVAAKVGYLPARQPVPDNGGARPEDWPRRLVLQLGAKPLSIRGRVVDQDGAGIAGAMVWVTDPTLLGIAAILPMYTEFLLAGGEVPAQVARMRVPLADDPTQDGNFTDMNSTTPPPSAGWFYVTADDDGAFELPGLLARDYVLRAIDPGTGLTGDTAPVAAGGSADVRITRAGLWPVVRGRVVSLRGEPLAGIEVQHSVRMFTARERVPGGRFEGNAMREVATVRSGADGSFELRDVSPTAAVLGFHGDAILPRSLTADRIEPADCVAVVEARCHVEVALADAAEADQVAARDIDGEPIDVVILRSGSHSAVTELDLHDGRSGVFVLGERASRLLLLRQGAVVREVPLALRPGTTQRVQ